jgi:hypothetical protein
LLIANAIRKSSTNDKLLNTLFIFIPPHT